MSNYGYLELNELVRSMARESRGFAVPDTAIVPGTTPHVEAINKAWSDLDWGDLLDHAITGPEGSTSRVAYDRLNDAALEEANFADLENHILDYECDECVTWCHCELELGPECEECDIEECECAYATWESEVTNWAVTQELHENMMMAAQALAKGFKVWLFVDDAPRTYSGQLVEDARNAA